MKIVLPVSVILAMIGGVFAAQAEMKLPDLKKQPSAQAVLDEHFAALNKCDWNRLLAQYPDDAQINLRNGTIVKGRPWADKNNIDPNLRNRPLVGVQMLIAMRPNGAGKWSGRLYNRDDGKTYTGYLNELDARTIRVEGCVLSILCGGENMTRIK